MKKLNNLLTFIFIGLFAFACITDEDRFYSFDNIAAPANVNAVFDIAQDNTGLVTVLPNSEGGVKYLVEFGDGETKELKSMEAAQHTYAEGVYSVDITSYGITGLTTKVTKELNVTFKAPENLLVTIVKDAVNPKNVKVSATADFAAVIDIYFGDVQDEVATHVLPGEEAAHLYQEPGEYTVKVIAKSAGIATTEYTETIKIDAASDPIFLPIDFESFTVKYAFADFGGVASSVVDNPDQSGVNSSARVGQSIKTAGAETWGGSTITLGEAIDFSAKKNFTMKVKSPKVGSVVKLKIENLDDANINMEVDATTTVADEWEELSFDFSAVDMSKTFHRVIVFFDFGNVGDGSTYLFDDVKLKFAEAPTSFMIEDFEGVAPEFTAFGNAAVEVVANPDKTGNNTSVNVVKMNKAAGAETWAGAYFKVTTPLDLDTYKNIKVKTWSPKAGVVVKLKLENADASIVHEVDLNSTVANAWETLSYDFSAAPEADYVTIVVFFDFGNIGDNSDYYYDDIELANEGGRVISESLENFEGDLPVFTDFGNATTEVIDNPDASGINTTAKVVKLTKASGAETWAGSFFDAGSIDLDTYKKISVKTWSPKAGIVVKLKLENADASVVHEVDLNTTVTNSWEQLTYDFSAAPAASYTKVVIFFDFGNAGDDSVYYYDEVELTN